MSAFSEAVKAIIKQNEKMIITSGVVKKINEKSIDVEREGLPDLLEVRFNSVLSSVESEFKITPKVGSAVLCGIIENDTSEAYLLGFSEIERVNITIDQMEFDCDPEGLKVQNGDESLKEILNDFMDEVNKILVIQGVTIDRAKVVAIKQRLNTVLR